MFAATPTSLISFISCEHGRMRREQRDISKRDLRKAMKYGTWTKAHQNRWMVEHEGITFILDQKKRREITSYRSLLAVKPIDSSELNKHKKARFVLEQKPEHCRSHTVLVIDNSGSMFTKDIPMYRDRHIAAYESLAMEYVAQGLLSKTCNELDVVSLVEFNEAAKVVFVREPFSWVLYNKILSRRVLGSHSKREDIRNQESRRADSNYLPALKETWRLLNDGRHDDCPLGVFFLSDGEPSDARRYRITPQSAQSRIANLVHQMSETYKETISLSAVGFGNESIDFSTLELTADSSNKATGSRRAKFTYCERQAYKIGKAASSLATSLTESLLSLSSLVVQPRRGGKRPIAYETGNTEKWTHGEIKCHQVYDPRVGRLVDNGSLPPGVLDAVIFRPSYIAMSTHACGSGAERLAFRCVLGSANVDTRQRVEIIAKETKMKYGLFEGEKFHEPFCKTQGLAGFLAEEFNKCVQQAMSSAVDRYEVPIISFLRYSVIAFEDVSVSSKRRSVMVEKMLDTKRFQWSKWNDNNGGVERRKTVGAPVVDIEREFEAIMARKATVHTASAFCAVVQLVEDDETSEEEPEDDRISSYLWRYWRQQRRLDPKIFSIGLPSSFLSFYVLSYIRRAPCL